MEPLLIYTIIAFFVCLGVLIWQLSYITITPWRKIKNTDDAGARKISR